MPDRRVGDRREGGSKKITVSFSTFIFCVLIAIIVFASIIICIISTKKAYNNGYNQALTDVSTPSDYTGDELEEITDSDFSALGTEEGTLEVTDEEASAVSSSSVQ